jgi:phenylacetate-CoA ligase
MKITCYSFFVETGYQLLATISPLNAWSHFKELQSNQWLPYDQLAEIRWEKLKRLLLYAYEHIPFYRQLWKSCGVNPHKFTSINDMQGMPVITKKELKVAQDNDEFLLSKKKGYEYAFTSGTTGERFKVPFSFSGFQKKYANHLRQIYASGWRLGMKSATLHYSGHSQFKGKYSGRHDDREPFMNFRETALGLAHRRRVLTPYFETFSGNDIFPRQWYDELKVYKPYLFETMDFNLLVLKDYIDRNNMEKLSIPIIYVLGTYSLALRNAMEKFFNAELFNRYSPHEIEGVAFACHEHKGMHMAIDSYHIEFLNSHNQPVSPEETGFITITDLDNYVLPLIRYQVGDLGHYYAGRCRCGRGLPLMGDIDGRARDLFTLKNGETIAPAKIAAVLQDESAVRLFQIVQSIEGTITVSIVPNKTLFTDTAEERIKHRLNVLLGKDEKIIIVKAEHIELEKNGKCCFVKRNLSASNN